MRHNLQSWVCLSLVLVALSLLRDSVIFSSWTPVVYVANSSGCFLFTIIECTFCYPIGTRDCGLGVFLSHTSLTWRKENLWYARSAGLSDQSVLYNFVKYGWVGVYCKLWLHSGGKCSVLFFYSWRNVTLESTKDLTAYGLFKRTLLRL